MAGEHGSASDSQQQPIKTNKSKRHDCASVKANKVAVSIQLRSNYSVFRVLRRELKE